MAEPDDPKKTEKPKVESAVKKEDLKTDIAPARQQELEKKGLLEITKVEENGAFVKFKGKEGFIKRDEVEKLMESILKSNPKNFEAADKLAEEFSKKPITIYDKQGKTKVDTVSFKEFEAAQHAVLFKGTPLGHLLGKVPWNSPTSDTTLQQKEKRRLVIVEEDAPQPRLPLEVVTAVAQAPDAMAYLNSAKGRGALSGEVEKRALNILKEDLKDVKVDGERLYTDKAIEKLAPKIVEAVKTGALERLQREMERNPARDWKFSPPGAPQFPVPLPPPPTSEQHSSFKKPAVESNPYQRFIKPKPEPETPKKDGKQSYRFDEEKTKQQALVMAKPAEPGFTPLPGGRSPGQTPGSVAASRGPREV